MEYLESHMTVDEIRRKTSDGTTYLTVNIAVPLDEIACSSRDKSLDGLNDITDSHIGHALVDIRYKPVGIDGDKVIIEVTGDASELLDEADEEQRQDEKRGLYAEHEDPAN